jgi:hypothetical protein
VRLARRACARRACARAPGRGTLAHSRFAYVRGFEQPDALLPHCWIVVRIDGKGFTKCARAKRVQASRRISSSFSRITHGRRACVARCLRRQVHRGARLHEAE